MFRPTASCIWNSFRSSDKGCLVLTGGREEERIQLRKELLDNHSPNLKFCEEITVDAFVVNLDNPYGNIGCVIMASGLGKRFGGNKLMADFCGQPMIVRVLDATEGIFSERVIVTRHEDVAKNAAERGVAVILHQMPHRSDTIRLGMEQMMDTDHCIFCPGDQPLLSQETLASMALAAANDRNTIWRISWEENRGAPIIFPRWSYDELLHLPEGKGGAVVVREHENSVRCVPAGCSEELVDADTPEILESLVRFTLRK